MSILFSENAWEDYLYWQTADQKVLKRIHALIKDTLRSPFSGIGKPEPLRHELSGLWSRRITGEHRLIYKAENDTLNIIACRYHY
jgi:toxin YoeB